MSTVEINPKKLKGEISPPPSKSLSHRAIICAALAKGTSIIDNIAFSEDIKVTIDAVRKMGASVDIRGNKLIISGENTFKNYFDCGNDYSIENTIDCNESGSTLRFMISILLIKNCSVKLIGRGQLGNRPMDPMYPIFEQDDIEYTKNSGPLLDMSLSGCLKGGQYSISGDVSSQFISGLLMALPLLEKDSTITVTSPQQSKGYIDLTLQTMKDFGIDIQHDNYQKYYIKGSQNYQSHDFVVESDYSQAAFYLCAAAIGNDIQVKNMNLDSLQGDKAIINCLEKLGCEIFVENNIVSVKANKLKGTIIDGSQFPDVIPVLAVVCAMAEGESRLVNIGRLRIKECDRLHAMAQELSRLGVSVEELEDSLIINGTERFSGAVTKSYADHRIAMSMAIASTCCLGNLSVEESECVSKSYPNFWEDFALLGGDIEIK